MFEHHTDLIDVFRRDPVATGRLVRIGVALPTALAIWAWLAGFVMPFAAVGALSALLVIAYGAFIALLTARLVRDDNSWRAGAAVQARRLKDDTRLPAPTAEDAYPDKLEAAYAEALEDEAAEAVPLASAIQRSFDEMQFMLALEEDVLRARREGHEMAVLTLDVTLPHGGHDPAALARLSREMAQLAVNQSKTIARSLSVGETEYVFALPESDARAAKAFVSKVVRALGDYWCHYGLAVYPADGTDALALFDAARRLCDESRQGKPAEPRSRLAFG